MIIFPKILQNKKIIILTGTGLVVIIAGMVISISASHSNKSTTNITTVQRINTNITNDNAQTQLNNQNPLQTSKKTIETTRINNDNPPIPTSQVVNEFTIKNWILSDNDIYSFQYPTDWKLQRTLFTNGQSIALIPLNKSYTPYTPTWSITVTKTDPANPIYNRELLYENSGFKKDSTSISGLQAERLRGTFPPNASETTAVQQTNIFFTRNTYSYGITYKYPGISISPQYEDLFKKITDTVSVE